MCKYAILSALSIALAICSGCYGPNNDLRDEATNETATQGPAPDNTEVNQRDADGMTATPFDQGHSETDVNITATVRQLILEDDGISVNGRNAKVITRQGIVTLRGVVDDAEESAIIEGIAAKVAGVSKVENQLEWIESP